MELPFTCTCIAKCFDIAGGFEVNFMDDVGQTLLNWASAFGTLEMVSHMVSEDIELKTVDCHNYVRN